MMSAARSDRASTRQSRILAAHRDLTAAPDRRRLVTLNRRDSAVP
jgi:hypothetical protein